MGFLKKKYLVKIYYGYGFVGTVMIKERRQIKSVL